MREVGRPIPHDFFSTNRPTHIDSQETRIKLQPSPTDSTFTPHRAQTEATLEQPGNPDRIWQAI